MLTISIILFPLLQSDAEIKNRTATSLKICCQIIMQKFDKENDNKCGGFCLWTTVQKLYRRAQVCEISRNSPGCGSMGTTWKKYLYSSSPASVAGFSRLSGFGDNFSREIITRPGRSANNVRSLPIPTYKHQFTYTSN